MNDELKLIKDLYTKGALTDEQAVSIMNSLRSAGGSVTAAKVINDARGHQLIPGVRVAFNYSGDIAIGVIEKITPGGEFHIRRETHNGTYYGANNPISKVKNSRSLMAITEVEDVEKAAADLRQQAIENYKQAKAVAENQLLKIIANAWDLDDVLLWLEEYYGKDWKSLVDK